MEPRPIDADALLAEIKRQYCTGCNDYHGLRCRACPTDDALDMVEDAPTLDYAPVVHGEWVEEIEHCPYCGARMDGKGGRD